MISYSKPSITNLEHQYVYDAVVNGWGEDCFYYIEKFEKSFSKKTFSIFSLKTRGSGTDHIIRANALIIKSNMIAAPQRIRVCGLIFKKELTQIIFELHSINFWILFDYLYQGPTVLR